ncbi:hypothetical protein BDV96DRAFT_576138 [Lophiotrema nucula]|uniref:Uncharacterized protein n=1 Tax=Lophiotrema nucula TaxID=690887 RepID=A0A6A5Z672_9PLEO|nr:hypothetical protein BDV96DRAFT_576138 [Lophiotrema nucula]
MAGAWQFLALQQKPANAKDPQVVQSPEVEVDDQDDEWYDTESTASGYSPVKKLQNANGDSSLVNVKSLSPQEEAVLLPYMPALFGTDLPPVGLEIQVAYENVNKQLRQLWLNHRGRMDIVDICQSAKETLERQNGLFPGNFTLKAFGKRPKPWRRYNVFKFERRWIDYFLREAEAHKDPEAMTESEIMDRKKWSSIPYELTLDCNRGDVLKLWDEWHEKKRVHIPTLPAAELQVDAKEPDLVTYVNGEAGGHGESPRTMMPPTSTDADALTSDGFEGVDDSTTTESQAEAIDARP